MIRQYFQQAAALHVLVHQRALLRTVPLEGHKVLMVVRHVKLVVKCLLHGHARALARILASILFIVHALDSHPLKFSINPALICVGRCAHPQQVLLGPLVGSPQ